MIPWFIRDLVLSLLITGWSFVILQAQESNRPLAASIQQQAKKLRSEQYQIASQVLKSFPNDFNAIRVMGYAHSSHGNLEKMAMCWQRCQKLEPKRPDVYDQLGRYYARTERYEQAIQSWNKVIQLEPDFPEVRQRIGFAFLNLGKTEQAQTALKKQAERTPNHAQTQYLLGETYFQMQRFQEAKTSFELALRREPQHAKACYGLVKTCARLSQPDELRKYAKQFERLEGLAIQADAELRKNHDDLTEMRKKLAVTCVDSGRVYLAQANPAAAKRLWLRATQVDKDHVQARLELASLFANEGDLKAAIQQYSELIRLQPQNVGHYKQVGLFYTRLKNYDLAESFFQKMIQQQPENAAGYRTLSKFYLNTNRNRKSALALAQRAVKLDPVADSYFVLGWSSAMNGNVEQARTALRKALEMDPNNATYRKVYAVVEKNSPSS